MGFSGLGRSLDDWSLTVIGIGLFLSFVVASLLGKPAKRLRSKVWPSPRGQIQREDTEDGYILSGTLVLLGLLLGFTFNMVVQRYEERRLLVVSEANAIGTSYLRAQILDEPYRTNLSQLLLRYTANRIDLGSAADRKSRDSLLVRNDELLNEIWSGVVAASGSAQAKGITTPLLLTFNEMIDRDADRKAARQTRVPEAVLLSLYLFMLVTAFLIGIVLDASAQRVTAGLLFLLLTMMLSVMIDLNRPTSGSIRESQQPLEQLYASLIRTAPPHLQPPRA